MTVGGYIDGFLRSDGDAGLGAAGTLAVTATPTTYAAGTLSIDRTVFLAFYARVRLTRPDVYIAVELMPEVVDTVGIDETLSDPIRYANFTLSTKRVAYFDVASVSRQNLPVDIDLWAGPPGTVLKWRAFSGTTETSQDSMPYRPRGVFRCVSDSAAWANIKGCINIPAFSGLTRGAILELFAQSAGVTISNVDSLGGGVVNKPIDVAGISVFDLINRYGEVEGWLARATEDGLGLEVIAEDQMLTGTPIFDFNEDDAFDFPEVLPNRPVTNWVLSTTEISSPAPSSDPGSDSDIQTETTTESGVDALGHPTLVVTEIKTNLGVEIQRTVTTWETVAVPGVADTGLFFQVTGRVTTSQTWAPFTYFTEDGTSRTRPSTMLTGRTIMTEALTGVPAAAGYTWVQGGIWTAPYASLLIVGLVTQSFTWADCFLKSSSATRMAYYAPLGAGYTYADGSIRTTPTFMWIMVEAIATQWSDFSDSPSPYVEERTSLTKWNITTPDTEAFAQFSITVKTWTPGSNSTYAVSESTLNADGSSSSTQNGGNVGTAPSVPAGSSDIAQFSQRVVLQNFDATGPSGYVKLTESPPTLDYAENNEELIAIAIRRVRRACAIELQISHKAIPWLRVGDHVSVTNRARSLLLKDAYVWSINRTATPVNGAMRQTTVVRIPPPWI